MTNEFQPSFSFVVSFADETVLPENASTRQFTFQELSGLSSGLSPEISEGGENRFIHRLPQTVKHGNLVLKRGIMDKESEMLKWLRQALEGNLSHSIETKTLKIDLLDGEDKAVMAWTFHNAWPVKLEIGGFDAMNNGIAVESAEFSYDYFDRPSA